MSPFTDPEKATSEPRSVVATVAVAAPVAPTLETVETGGLPSLTPVETANVRPSCFSSTIHEVLFVLTSTMAIASSSLLTGSVFVTTSYIGRDLDMTTAQVTWIASASSLTAGAFLLMFGKLADLFGRKALFVASLFSFSVLALGTGFVNDGITLDILNGLLGVTCASSVPPAVGILGACYEKPSKRKNAAFACFSAGNPLGFVFGTLFGGIAATIFDWRASYWLMSIIFFVFTIIGIFTIPRDFTPKQPLNREALKQFDIIGTICVIFGIGMFSAALSLGDTAPQGWKTGYVLALLIVGILLLVGFVLWDLWYPAPLVPMGIWRDRNFSLLLSILMFGYLAFAPSSFFIALYFQNIWRLSPLGTAVRLLPMVVMGLATNVVAAFILHRVSNKLIMGIGAVSYLISSTLLAMNRESSNYWTFTFFGLIFAVIGADLQFNVANMYVMSSMPASKQSLAGGLFQTVTRLTTTLGFGIATAVFNSVSEHPSLASYWDVRTQPYSATFWMSVASSILGIALVPFLTIKTQGGKAKSSESKVSPEADSPAVEADAASEKS